MQRWFILLRIGVVILVIIVGLEIWWLMKPKSIDQNNTIMGCEFEGKTYLLHEKFVIQRSDGCGLCVCGENYEIICAEADCEQGG